jgi:uncharacterized protein (TIGR00269 family)
MNCKNCKSNPVIKLPNSNVSLCKSHFNRYFEKKVRKCIRLYNLIDKKDKILIALSGGKDSLSLAYILNQILKPTKIKLEALIIDEGSRKEEIKAAEKLCKKLKIKLHKTTYKKEFKFTLFDIAEKLKGVPCAACGTLRRSLINKKARELKATKLATGHNLDDEAQSILMNQFKANMAISARLGPVTGITDDPKFVRRIKPLYFLTEAEVETFAKINNLSPGKKICPFRCGSFRKSVMIFLNDFEKKYPGTKHGIVKSFLEILPLLKKGYSKTKLKYCKICKEPCSQPDNICQSCKIIKKLRR